MSIEQAFRRIAVIAVKVFGVSLIPLAATLHAGHHVLENFDDGSVKDNNPVTWLPGWGPDGALTEDDGFVLTARPGLATSSFISGHQWRDYSIRATITGDNNWAGVVGRLSNDTGYAVYLHPDGELAINYVNSFDKLASAQTGLNPVTTDVTMVVDMFGDQISLAAWEAGSQAPEAPQIILEDFEFQQGTVGIWVGSGDATFKSIEVDTEPFPFQRSLLGDFDNNGILDAADINQLVRESATSQHRLDLDVTGDELVDSDDVAFWVKDLKGTWIGDSNLDGVFDSSDFVEIFGAGKFELDEDADWTSGDWTGDLRFNSVDFVAAFQDGGYEKGLRAAVGSVPEPSCFDLLVIGMLSVMQLLRGFGTHKAILR